MSTQGDWFKTPEIQQQPPGQAPANTPGPAPANTPGPAPANTPGPAPANTPGQAPANTQGQAPGAGQGDLVFEIDLPVETQAYVLNTPANTAPSITSPTNLYSTTPTNSLACATPQMAQIAALSEPSTPPFPSAEQDSSPSQEVVTAFFAENRFENFVLYCVASVHSAARFTGGLFGVWFLLAWLATIPVVQLLTLGFFVEVTCRVARSGRLRDGLLGAAKGWTVCKGLFGVAITWLPLLVVSRMRYDAWLIDPLSSDYATWRFWEYVIFGLTVVHWIGVGLTGGQLRHFFWPLLVPWYMSTGLVKKCLSFRGPQWLIEQTIGQVFPKTVAAYYRAEPLSNWFVPAVLWRHVRQGTLLSEASERFWCWIESLRPLYFFNWGLGTFAGLVLWFGGPTLWLLIATRANNPGVEGLFYLLGMFHLYMTLQYYPLVHCRYCATGQWRSYFQWQKAASRYWYSPLRISLAMAMTMILTLPLWLTRIAMIPYELWWLMSALYVVCLWPVWLTWGWAWHHASTRSRSTTWAWGLSLMPFFWTLVFGQMLFTLLSIYLSWQGVFNILLHPSFNIPSPFSPNAG